MLRLTISFSVCICLLSLLFSAKFLQILQLEGYDVKQYLKWLFGTGISSFSGAVASSVVLVAAGILTRYAWLFALPVTLTFFFASYKIPCKVKLKITKRTARLSIILFALDFMVVFLAAKRFGYNAALSVFAVQPLMIAVSTIIVLPMERRITAYYLKKAKEKLDKIKPVKIAITGSYGKTTAKNILTKMLSKKYNVCATPKSYNTPQGISLAINTALKKNDRIFIAEMGARRRGDIKELTETVMPDIAIITAVGKQHLATFKTFENVKKTKYELIENLPCGGKAFFNGDNEVCREFYEKYDGNKVLTGKIGYVRYDNVVMSSRGLSFDMIIDGKSEYVTTKLLGKHIPSMICQCAAVALSFGVSVQSIKNAINELQPVAHRLQMIYNGNDVIIDDSFNSNEQGFESAVGVLSYYSYLIKVLITPGVVELGNEQKEINYRLGRLAGKTCDYVIVLGENSEALKKGALEEGLPSGRIYEAKSIAAAMEFYKKISGGKAVLFENDLPDNYR